MNTRWVFSSPASGALWRQEDPEGKISLALLGWAAEAGGQVFTEGEWKHTGFWVQRTGQWGVRHREGWASRGWALPFLICLLAIPSSQWPLSLDWLVQSVPLPPFKIPVPSSPGGPEARQTGPSLPHALAFRKPLAQPHPGPAPTRSSRNGAEERSFQPRVINVRTSWTFGDSYSLRREQRAQKGKVIAQIR